MAYVAKVRTPGGTWVPIAAQQADTSGFVLKTGTTGTVNLSTANLTGAGMDLRHQFPSITVLLVHMRTTASWFLFLAPPPPQTLQFVLGHLGRITPQRNTYMHCGM
jgi:hypothetical protein